MPVRNGVLVRWLSPNGAGAVIATVAPTDTWLIKSVSVYNSTAAPQAVNLFLANAAFNIFRILYAGTIPAASAVNLTDWAAAGPGDTVNAQPGVAGVHFWLGGAALPGHL